MSKMKAQNQRSRQIPLCEIYNPDTRRAERVRALLPDEESLHDTARVLKACADPARVKILYALGESELCVCELAHLLGLSMPTVSYHLRILDQAKLIEYRKQGRLVFYRLRDECLTQRVQQLVELFRKDRSPEQHQILQESQITEQPILRR